MAMRHKRKNIKRRKRKLVPCRDCCRFCHEGERKVAKGRADEGLLGVKKC